MPNHSPNTPRITLAPIAGRARVTCNEHVVADSHQAIQLNERGYPPRLYFPSADVAEHLLQRSDTTTHCPFKGDTHYFHVVTSDQRVADAGWCYAEPIRSMSAIARHLAFDHPLLRIEMLDH